MANQVHGTRGGHLEERKIKHLRRVVAGFVLKADSDRGDGGGSCPLGLSPGRSLTPCFQGCQGLAHHPSCVIAPGIPGRRRNIQLPDATAAWDFIITSQPCLSNLQNGKTSSFLWGQLLLGTGHGGETPDPRSRQAETCCWTSGPTKLAPVGGTTWLWWPLYWRAWPPPSRSI